MNSNETISNVELMPNCPAINKNEDFHYKADRIHNYFSNKSNFPFKTIHKWEGKVEQIIDSKVFSLLYSPEEDAWDEYIFSLSDVHNDDISLVVEGGLFNLYLGYKTTNGTRKKEKILKFRRINLGGKSNIDNILTRLKEVNFNSLLRVR